MANRSLAQPHGPVKRDLRALSDNIRFKKTAWLVSLAGLGLFATVIGYQGFGSVSAAISVVGWGLAWITLLHLLPLLIDTIAWQRLLEPQQRIDFLQLTRISWIGEAVNSLFPVAMIGGGVVRARLLTSAGVPKAIGGASVVVDLTVAVITLIIFSLGGVAVLVAQALPGYSSLQLLPGLMVFSLLAYGFYVAQRRGMFLVLARRIERMQNRKAGGKLSDDAALLDRAIAGIYERQGAFWSACLIRFGGWLIGAGEVWLALYFLHYPVTLLEAVMLESLGQAIRSAAFVIPGALGVQEGAYLLLGVSIGIPPSVGIALSLVKRIRELSLGVPALLFWQGLELRRLRQHPLGSPTGIGEGQ